MDPQCVLAQFARRGHRLYSLPAVAMQVIELTRQADIDTRAIKECIERDPALTTKILRVVNSSLFGLSQPVADLNQAVALLGTKPLRLLVLGFSLPHELFTGLEAAVLARYWRNSLIKAVAAREISERIWRLPGDEALVAGLLQDIGMLALVQDLGDAYVKFLDSVYADGTDLAAMERRTLGFQHAMFSAALLEHWGLPETLVRAIAATPDADGLPQRSEHEEHLPRILHLAELITRLLTRPTPAQLEEILQVGRRYRELTMDQLCSLVRSLEKAVPQLAEVLSLQLPGDTNYCDILLDAHRQLSLAADDCSGELCAEAKPGRALAAESRELNTALEKIMGSPGAAARTVAIRPLVTAQEPPDGALQPCEPGSWDVCPPHQDRHVNASVAAAISRCRQARCALSVLLAKLDGYESLWLSHGPLQSAHIVQLLNSIVSAVVDREGDLLRLPESQWTLILPGYDRQRALELARQLIHRVRHWSLAEKLPSLTLSAGLASLAVPPKNFPGQELVRAAERCLIGVQLSGGDGVKSIDIC